LPKLKRAPLDLKLFFFFSKLAFSLQTCVTSGPGKVYCSSGIISKEIATAFTRGSLYFMN